MSVARVLTAWLAVGFVLGPIVGWYLRRRSEWLRPPRWFRRWLLRRDLEALMAIGIVEVADQEGPEPTYRLTQEAREALSRIPMRAR